MAVRYPVVVDHQSGLLEYKTRWSVGGAKHCQWVDQPLSGLPPLEAPVMIAEKRKLFFSFLSWPTSQRTCVWIIDQMNKQTKLKCCCLSGAWVGESRGDLSAVHGHDGALGRAGPCPLWLQWIQPSGESLWLQWIQPSGESLWLILIRCDVLLILTSMNSTFWWVSVTHLDPVWRLVHFDFNELNVLMSHCNSSCFGMMSVHVTCIMASTITIIIISISITVKIIIINIIVVICVRWCEFVQACSIALLCFKALFTNSFDHVHVIGHTRGITLTFHSMLS